MFRSLFGNFKLDSPRFYECRCQVHHGQSSNDANDERRQSFSPLAELLPDRSAPELVYFQTKWAGLVSYGLTGRLLADFLPVDQPVSKAVVSRQVQRVAKRLESELSDEPLSGITQLPLPWEEPPPTTAPLVVGLDGGYIHARKTKASLPNSTELASTAALTANPSPPTGTGEAEVALDSAVEPEKPEKSKDKAEVGNWFEVIVGKSIASSFEGVAEHSLPTKCFGFVNNYDTKSRRRVYETLKGQGMQPHQPVIFMSDGGDTVRQVQLYLNPQSEVVLDWFHVTMRLTVLKQMAKGLADASADPKAKNEVKAAGEVQGELPAEDSEDNGMPWLKPELVIAQIERLKWKLWHGQLFAALQVVKELLMDLDMPGELPRAVRKLLKATRELNGYLKANREYIVNYGERFRNGERISSGFAESTVNQLISRRFVKKQQMKWTPEGAHLLLQVRIKVVDEELGKTFERWYPGMQLPKPEACESMAAA